MDVDSNLDEATAKMSNESPVQNDRKIKHTEELSLELMKVDKAEEARKARRDWLRRMKVSPGIWVRVTAEVRTYVGEP